MELFAPDPMRIASAGAGASDAAPDELAGGTPEPLRSELRAAFGDEKLKMRAIDLIAYASDASPYRRIPRAVIVARDAADVAAAFAAGKRLGLPVTLRAGGTSLNGQAQTGGLMVDVRRHWSGIEVIDNGRRVRARPGTLLGEVNRALAPQGRRLGPDPASKDIATVGGVIANNSGGMRCGVTHDSYRTVTGLEFVLPSGTAIDTAAPGAAARFAAAEPELAAGLAEIRDEIRADRELAARIERKFEIKNTMGYRLCSFLDADEPLEIFRRLLVGSEGTLAFIAGAELETVAVPAETTLAWLHFEGIEAAVDPVPGLVALGATAVELMVAPALIVASHNIAGTPAHWRELPPESAALLVEFSGETEGELRRQVSEAMRLVGAESLIREAEWTSDAERIEVNWSVREGMHGLIGRLRAPGTALIVEDVCVAPERIAECAREIQALLGEHGFLQGVAGHASAGNLHFMLTPDFSLPADTARYEAFMEGLVETILDRYDGSLKAEHGTGLNMAPYLEREWGAAATELMWRIKRLADPDGVLNPGVVLNADPGIHLQHLKTTPPIEESATACVECGFCEPACPSRDLTLTPRQRIVVRREMFRQPDGSPLQRALAGEFEYDGLETCAADSSCRMPCPVGIDTGKLVTELRERQHSEAAERRAERLARHWKSAERGARSALRAGRAAGPLMRLATGVNRALISDELAPSWPRNMPPAAPAHLPASARDGAAAVYMPACVNRIFGRPRGAPESAHVAEAMVVVSERAGRPVWIPKDVAGTCCATPWVSKGFRRGAELMANRTIEALWRWSGEGTLPVVTDASSCALGLREDSVFRLTGVNRERQERMEILDPIDWVHDHLLERLTIARVGSAAVHPPCAARRLGNAGKLRGIAAEMAERVVTPGDGRCCGYAGDRGMLHPELTRAATAAHAADAAAGRCEAHLSSNRPCEIGLQAATGDPYESILVGLERATR